MKRGFALLETIIVITFVSVSLLLLYGTFTSLIQNKEKNILYDDAAYIYQMYYLKEYLSLYDLEQYFVSDHIVEISCSDLAAPHCDNLFSTISLQHLYLVDVHVDEDLLVSYSTTLKQYYHTLSSDDENYWLIGEFLIDGAYHYASIGVVGT